jgi:hypothetical protein
VRSTASRCASSAAAWSCRAPCSPTATSGIPSAPRPPSRPTPAASAGTARATWGSSRTTAPCASAAAPMT